MLTVAPMEDAAREQVDEVVFERDGQQSETFFVRRNARSGLDLFFLVAWTTVFLNAKVLKTDKKLAVL